MGQTPGSSWLQINKMASKFSLIRRPRRSKHHKTIARALEKCPQRKGFCLRIMVQHPKKPNSAHRKVARIRLTTGGYVTAQIPGEGHNLQTHSTVLIRGGRVRDRPGVNHRIIRGVHDAAACSNRTRQRSKYGMPRMAA